MTKNKKINKSEASFLLSNNMKTCTISRLMKGIQLLACNLGTELAMLCTIYHLLYGSEIFRDFLFFHEDTVLPKKLKTNH